MSLPHIEPPLCQDRTLHSTRVGRSQHTRERREPTPGCRKELRTLLPTPTYIIVADFRISEPCEIDPVLLREGAQYQPCGTLVRRVSTSTGHAVIVGG
eukprot:1554320-Rhodomonas_salina.4